MDENSAPGRPRGSRVSRPRRRSAVAFSIVGLLAAALLAVPTVGAIRGAFDGAAGGSGGPGESSPSAGAGTDASPEPEPTPDPRALPASVVPPAPIRSCSVAGLLEDRRLGTFQSRVVNAATGEILFERAPEVAAAPASSMKVLTAAAALAVLGPDYRASTRVVLGTEPGTVVLVGGGDLTLSRLPTGQEPVYTGAAHLDDLAAQTRAAWSAAGRTEPIRRILLDTGYFGPETWHESWPGTERAAGWLSHITSLQVDADRENPRVFLSPRGGDPVARAGSAFAAYFPGASTAVGTAPEGATVLGEVRSAPLSALLPLMLIPSDNTLAEMLGRQVAIALGTGNTLEALGAAIPEALAGYGIDTAGLRVVDASGMSPLNAISPAYLTSLYEKINAREGTLGLIRDGLAVSGQSGTLGYPNRFTGENAVARGHILGKTGSITQAYTLGGMIDAADGSTLVFSIFATGRVSESARQGIDTVATGFYRCGNALSNS